MNARVCGQGRQAIVNRRESLKSLLAGLTAAGAGPLSVSVLQPPFDSKREIFVISAEEPFSPQTVAYIRQSWERSVKDTDFEQSRLLILDQGLKLERVTLDPAKDEDA